MQTEEVEFVVQVAGKRRDSLRLPVGSTEAEVLEAALGSERVRKYVLTQPKRVVFVPGRLINLIP